MDRPSRTICSSQSADAQVRCVQFLLIYPATYTLVCRLDVLRNQNVAGVPTRRSLVCCPPAASGFVARPGSNLQLPPAMLASPAGFLRQTHAYTTRSQDSPSQGAVTGHSQPVHTHKPNDNAGTRFPGLKNYNLIQADTTFEPSLATTNLTH